MADQRVPMTSSGRRPCDHVGLRAIQPDEIEVHGRETVQGDSAVADERNRLQKHLGEHNGGPAVEVYAAPESSDVADEIPEVAQAPFAECFPRRSRMHVDDV